MIKRCTVFGAVQDKELGIRDLVGGNVSKNGKPIFYHSSLVNFAPQDKEGNVIGDPSTVSYTHLTLPTNEQQCRSRWSPYH